MLLVVPRKRLRQSAHPAARRCAQCSVCSHSSGELPATRGRLAGARRRWSPGRARAELRSACRALALHSPRQLLASGCTALLSGSPLGFGFVAPPILTVICSGIAGSAFTYGLTWVRERRRTNDAYRAPQRVAIGDIVAATYELTLRVYALRDVNEELAKDSSSFFRRADPAGWRAIAASIAVWWTCALASSSARNAATAARSRRVCASPI